MTIVECRIKDFYRFQNYYGREIDEVVSLAPSVYKLKSTEFLQS